MGLMDTVCVLCVRREGLGCACVCVWRGTSTRRMWGGRRGSLLWQRETEERREEREAAEAPDIHEDASGVFFLSLSLSRRGDTLLVCRETQGDGEGEADEKKQEQAQPIFSLISKRSR